MKSAKILKILGVTVRDDLRWNDHVDNITAKASRIYLLKQLKRAGVDPKSLMQFYCAYIRSVLEYACQAFHSSLPAYLSFIPKNSRFQSYFAKQYSKLQSKCKWIAWIRYVYMKGKLRQQCHCMPLEHKHHFIRRCIIKHPTGLCSVFFFIASFYSIMSSVIPVRYVDSAVIDVAEEPNRFLSQYLRALQLP